MSFGIFSLVSENKILSSSGSAGYNDLSSASGPITTDVTNLTATLKVSGNRYVLISLLNYDLANFASVSFTPRPASTDILAAFYFKRASTVVAEFNTRQRGTWNTPVQQTSVGVYEWPAPSFLCLDMPPAGTYTWKATTYHEKVDGSGSAGWRVNYCKLFVAELMF